MKEAKFGELVKQNAEYFAQEVCLTFLETMNETFRISNTAVGTNLFTNPEGLIIYCSFAGAVEGDYYLQLNPETTDTLKKELTMRYGISDQDLDSDVISFLMEILNVAGAKSVEEIIKTFDFVFLKPATALIGKATFPDIFSGKVSIKGRFGIINCIMSINLATLDATDKVLENKIKKRNEQIKKEKQRIAETARKAGMADIAREILHNVGNVLNSISTSSHLILDMLKHSNINSYLKAYKLIEENKNDLSNYLLHNPKGKRIIEYFGILAKSLAVEKNDLINHSKRVQEKVALIAEIIDSQRKLVDEFNENETLIFNNVLEESLAFLEEELKGITIQTDLPVTDRLFVPKVKLMHVLIFILRNCIESFDTKSKTKSITIKTERTDNEQLQCSITDNGSGIKKENLVKIFTHGYSTKPGHSGFGLHTAANFVAEMNGKIHAESDGNGMGTGIFLSLPIKKDSKKQN